MLDDTFYRETLDLFAANALQGVLASQEHLKGLFYTPKAASAIAYDFAEAMMAERKARHDREQEERLMSQRGDVT